MKKGKTRKPTRLRVSIQNVPVCTGTTSTHLKARGRVAGDTRWRVGATHGGRESEGKEERRRGRSKDRSKKNLEKTQIKKKTGQHLHERTTESNHWMLPKNNTFPIPFDHSRYLIKLLRSSYPEGNSEGNEQAFEMIRLVFRPGVEVF